MTDTENQPLLAHGDVAHEVERPKSSDIAERTIESDVIPETATVGRQIGWASAYVLVISRVIGSGVFAMPGTVLQTVGSPALALILWSLGALFAWASLAIDMEFGCMLPRSGGIKVYLEYTYRWPKFFASVMVAVQAVLLGLTATNCIIFAKYTIYAFGLDPGDLEVKGLAIGMFTAITIVHGCFYRTGIWIQNVLGWLKIGLIVFMILTGLFVVIIRPSPKHSQSEPWWFNDPWRDSDFAWNNLSTSFFKVFYSYAGLSNINNVLNEVKNPVQTLRSVGPAALWTSCFTYLLINVAYLQVVPVKEVKQSRELIAALFFERVFGASVGGIFFPLAIAISAVGNVMVVTFSQARLNQEVARQGFLPWAHLLASSKPFGAPLGALLVHYVPTLLVIACPPSATVYSFIADVEGYAAQFYSLAVTIGLLLLRRRRPELKRPFKAWIPAVWVRILLSFALLAAPFFPSKEGHSDVNFFYASYALVAVGIILFGALWWLVLIKVYPWWKGFEYGDEADILDDGTVVTRLVRKDA